MKKHFDLKKTQANIKKYNSKMTVMVNKRPRNLNERFLDQDLPESKKEMIESHSLLKQVSSK